MRAVLLVNAGSGRGRSAHAADALQTALASRGAACSRLSVGSARAQVLEACSGASALVAIGGDGTVSAAAAIAATARIALAILPTGTENLAARELGFDGHAERLAGAMARGGARPLDLGQVDGQPFVVMASIGFDADLVHAVHARRSGPITRLHYAAAALRMAARWRAPLLTVTVDGRALFEGAGQVVVANCRRYGAGLDPARDADPSDGELDAVVLPARGPAEVARWVLRLRRSGWRGEGAVMARGRKVVVEGQAPLGLQVDGDPAAPSTQPHRYFSVSRGALKVVDMWSAE